MGDGGPQGEHDEHREQAQAPAQLPALLRADEEARRRPAQSEGEVEQGQPAGLHARVAGEGARVLLGGGELLEQPRAVIGGMLLRLPQRGRDPCLGEIAPLAQHRTRPLEPLLVVDVAAGEDLGHRQRTRRGRTRAPHPCEQIGGQAVDADEREHPPAAAQRLRLPQRHDHRGRPAGAESEDQRAPQHHHREGEAARGPGMDADQGDEHRGEQQRRHGEPGGEPLPRAGAQQQREHVARDEQRAEAGGGAEHEQHALAHAEPQRVLEHVLTAAAQGLDLRGRPLAGRPVQLLGTLLGLLHQGRRLDEALLGHVDPHIGEHHGHQGVLRPPGVHRLVAGAEEGVTDPLQLGAGGAVRCGGGEVVRGHRSLLPP